jgi:hypothetical protein
MHIPSPLGVGGKYFCEIKRIAKTACVTGQAAASAQAIV